jgi:GT2 family glycosyltransferase
MSNLALCEPPQSDGELESQKAESGDLKISVLMSTYAQEAADNLKASLESLRHQSRPPDQIVLVLDGPVGLDQEEVIAEFSRGGGSTRFDILRLAENGGLANALNAGLPICDGDYIARMDSDDLCCTDRLEIQAAYAAAHRDIDVVCSWNDEFFDDGARGGMKTAPTNHDAVVKMLRWRNVLQHSTVFIKAATLRAIGGYDPRFGLLEDYDLFIRLALSGARYHVVPKILVHIRSSSEQRRRRGGLRYCRHELSFRYHYYRRGFLTFPEFLVVTSLYSVFRLISGGAREQLYFLTRT